MERVPEPELMQNRLQVKAYAEADFSNSDDSFLRRIDEYLFQKGKKLDSQSLILDLGCGPGNITERLSRRWPYSKVFGIDGSKPMLDEARRRQYKQRQFGHLANISYTFCDLSLIADRSISFEKPANLVVSNSFLHHLHNPSKLWKSLKSLTSKGSVHLHRDLRRPFSMDKSLELQKKYLPNSPPVLVNDYLSSLQAAFTVEEVKTQLQNEGLDCLSVYEFEDRYLEVVGIF